MKRGTKISFCQIKIDRRYLIKKNMDKLKKQLIFLALNITLNAINSFIMMLINDLLYDFAFRIQKSFNLWPNLPFNLYVFYSFFFSQFLGTKKLQRKIN